MTEAQWLQLVRDLAWPVVALVALFFVWKTDAIGKLVKVTAAIDDFKLRLNELIESEERLSKSAGSIGEITSTLTSIQDDFVQLKADVENIRDRVDQRSDAPVDITPNQQDNPVNLSLLFEAMDKKWMQVNNCLEEIFGWFDRRSTAGEAYRFAHGNRKGPRLEYEEAEKIGRLHSSIKSYRRRYGSLPDWLTEEVSEDFIRSCDDVLSSLSRLKGREE